MLTEKEFIILIHKLGTAADTLKELKKDTQDLVSELDDLAKQFVSLKEKLK